MQGQAWASQSAADGPVCPARGAALRDPQPETCQPVLAPVLVSLHFRNIPWRSLFASRCFAHAALAVGHIPHLALNLSRVAAWHLGAFIMYFTVISALKFLNWKLLIPKSSLCAFLRSWGNDQSCKMVPGHHQPYARQTTPANGSLAKQNKLVRWEITSPSFLKCKVQTYSSRFVAP